ncbi:ABC transporter substrate-binding protein [Halotalea alkalilenta]|uniref:ABC transporter substrate-binding protein n=1 Tax=Halotalea alkalilenta TaxID=376489 RepID=UPI0006936D55|nr:ABC transporter substrate-binding protein [Halotalea alkalilenta]
MSLRAPARTAIAGLVLALGLAWMLPAAGGQRHTDLAGHQFELSAAPERIFLAQPRLLYALAALDEHIDQRLVGWRSSLALFDPFAFDALREVMPGLETLPTLGEVPTPPLDAEALVGLAPDLVIFNLSEYGELAGGRLLELLDRLEIPYLFVDFHLSPLANQQASLALLGDVLDRRERAEEINAFIDSRLAEIDRRLAAVEQRPSVLLNIAPGLRASCCRTNARGGLADLLERAKGGNIADAERLGSDTPLLSAEYVLDRDPEVIISTAATWGYGNEAIRAGFGVAAQETRADLERQTRQLPGWQHLRAIQQGRDYVLWHYLHHGPFAFIALEAIAGWLHPDATAGLDPQRDLDEFFTRFMPIAPQGTFFTGATTDMVERR